MKWNSSNRLYQIINVKTIERAIINWEWMIETSKNKNFTFTLHRAHCSHNRPAVYQRKWNDFRHSSDKNFFSEKKIVIIFQNLGDRKRRNCWSVSTRVNEYSHMQPLFDSGFLRRVYRCFILIYGVLSIFFLSFSLYAHSSFIHTLIKSSKNQI